MATASHMNVIAAMNCSAQVEPLVWMANGAQKKDLYVNEAHILPCKSCGNRLKKALQTIKPGKRSTVW